MRHDTGLGESYMDGDYEVSLMFSCMASLEECCYELPLWGLETL